MNAKWMASVAGLALAVSAGVLAGCAGAGQEQEHDGSVEAVAVRSAPVTDTVLARPIVAAGTVAPKEEVPLSFKVGGVIERITVDPGDVVKAGDVLAALNLREVDAMFTKARSAAEKAKRDLARARRLYADSVVTLAQLQDTETADELARADVETAAFNRRYAVIASASAGTVLRRLAEPGETVSPGSTVLVLGSRARGSVVRVGLADRDAVLVRTGDAASARFDALPGREFRGEVSQVAAAADPGTGTYAVEISLRDADVPTAGLVGQVEIRPSVGAPARLIPIEAILEADGSDATVYALSADGGRAERRRVSIAFIDGNRVAVASGLDGASAVLTDGAAYVDQGAAVRVTP